MMDVLRLLASLPARLILLVGRVLGALLRGIAWVLSPLFGRLGWQAPRWLAASDARLHARPVAIGTGIWLLLALIVAGIAGHHWYSTRPQPPQPQRVTFSVTPPAITDYRLPAPEMPPLLITFSGSVAPLTMSDAGISISPAVVGRWSWRNDRELSFTPAGDWPVGQAYDVRFDVAKAFAPQALLADDRLTFSTAAFTATVESSEFYQDPQRSELKQVVVALRFSHPVDSADLAKRVSLKFDKNAAPAGAVPTFAISYDEHHLQAWIRSQAIAVPAKDGEADVTIDKGLRARAGGTPTPEPLVAKVAVPGLYSLAISSIDTTLVDNARFEPEQVVMIATSHPVRDEDLAKRVHAWLLPRDKPGETVGEPWPWTTEEVSAGMLAKASSLELRMVPGEHDADPLQSFAYRADPGRSVYVQVDKGLVSPGGYQLGRSANGVVVVPAYPELLRFLSEGSLLSLNGDRRIAIVARNLPGVKLEIARVIPNQLQHLVSFNRGTLMQPRLESMNADHITERFEKTIAFDETEPGKAHYEAIDLGEYLGSGEQLRQGVFLLRLQRWDPAEVEAVAEQGAAEDDVDGEMYEGSEEGYSEGEDSEESSTASSDSRLIVVTDLGVLVKKSLDESQDVFVQSIRDGAPVDGATVDVIALNGSVLASQATDAGGHAAFAALTGFERDKKPMFYRVRKGADLSFLPVDATDRRLDYSRFDIGGDTNARNQGQLGAWLFSDRGIYRPGDEFHVGMIVRAADWAQPLLGIPLIAEVIDPRGVRGREERLRLDAAGFLSISMPTEESSPSGAWVVNLALVKDNHADIVIGSTTVQVKEFLPDRMKVSARLDSSVVEGWIKPDALKATVNAQNLFGTPASGRRVSANLTLRPAYPAFRSYADYQFYDTRRAKDGYSDPLEDGETDAAGDAVFDLGLGKYGNSTYQLYFVAQVFEPEGGRSVATETSALISTHDFLVGSKADGNLAYIARDAERGVQLIAINNVAKMIAQGGLTAAIIERKYVSVLTRQDSGSYRYESRLKEMQRSSTPLTIAAGGNHFALPTATPGEYALEIRDTGGEVLNRVEFSVAGAGNVARSLDRNAELELALSKPEYAPGDMIEIAVRAPYAGSGLITIERDKVYAHAWFKATTASSVQTIRVPADFEGNGYVNVQFIRDPSSDEVFMSPLSYGVVPFAVDRSARRLEVKLQAPALIKPGQMLGIDVTAARGTRVVVFAVDEGILQVARYQLGDPLDYFYRKRMLDVRTAQILDLILPDFARLMAMAAPGGDSDSMLGRHLNPFKRKRDKPVAYWSGIVDVDGSRHFEYPIADNYNGRVRVMAVAVSAQRVATAQTSTTVRGDFVLSPNVPVTAAPGDEFEVSVGVANNITDAGGGDLPIELKLDPGKNFALIGAGEQKLALASMREGVATFRLRAGEVPGSATLAFSVSGGGKSAQQRVDVSIRPPQPYRHSAQFGEVGVHKSLDVGDVRDMFNQYARRDIALSASPLVLARGLSAYLADFEYACTEQLVSRAFPALVLGQKPEFADSMRGARAGADAKQDQAGVIALLRTRQNAEGGFGVWTATPIAQPFVTAYATHYLIEAREHAIAVPQGMLDAANGALTTIAADASDSSVAGLRERAYAVYLLTRQGTVTTNHLAAIRQQLEAIDAAQWKDDLVAVWLAASYQLLKQQDQADTLIAPAQQRLSKVLAANAAYRYERYYDDLIQQSTTLYVLARHFPERAKALPPGALGNSVNMLQRGWYNTLSAALSVLALDAYGSVGAIGTDTLTIAEVDAQKKATSIGKADGVLLRGAFSDATKMLRLGNQGPSTAWFALNQAGFDRGVPGKEIRDGIEIRRDFSAAAGNSLAAIHTGDEINVTLRLRATGSDGIGDIAVVDLLPGGFEVVQQTHVAPIAGEEGVQEPGPETIDWGIAVGATTLGVEYADVREDRVVLHATATSGIGEFTYRIKATNPGVFAVPPAYAESLYDRSVQARSASDGGKLTVSKPVP